MDTGRGEGTGFPKVDGAKLTARRKGTQHAVGDGLLRVSHMRHGEVARKTGQRVGIEAESAFGKEIGHTVFLTV